MSENNVLTTADILSVFTDEVTVRGGKVNDCFNDGRRLFARSVLPPIQAPLAGDRFQGGVALRADDQEIWLHPYLFRLVCRNGAIMVQTLATRHVDSLQLRSSEDATLFLREAVASCCDADVFTASVNHMRKASETQADEAIRLMPMLSKLPPQIANRFLGMIAERFARDADRSTFGLVNSITSVARDTRDPELRWRLEEWGGRLAMSARSLDPTKTPDDWIGNAMPLDQVEQETISYR